MWHKFSTNFRKNESIFMDRIRDVGLFLFSEATLKFVSHSLHTKLRWKQRQLSVNSVN